MGDRLKDSRDETLAMIADDMHVSDDAVCLDLWYPRSDDRPKAIQIGLMDVRAADDLRVSYDFERDGWVISQPRDREVDRGSYIDTDRQWIEVGFFAAWAMEPEDMKAERHGVSSVSSWAARTFNETR